jgi:hypothetical protein
MLNDPHTIDMMMAPAPGVTMLIIQDFTPWEKPDDDIRLKQFKAKLGGYAAYVASAKFNTDHPNGDRSKVVISVLTMTPAGPRMKTIKNVYTPGKTAYEILVSFAEDAPANPPAKKPWWKLW